MATYDGRESSAVIQSLSSHPGQYDFYQAIRLLASPQDDDTNELELLDQSIEFNTESGNQFHATDIAGIEIEADKTPKLTVSTFGLTGPLGPLPPQYGEWFNSQQRSGRQAIQAFLNIFEHRFIAMLYMVKKRLHEGLHSGSRQTSKSYEYLRHVSGLPSSFEQGRSIDLKHKVLLPFAGLLAGGRSSAASVSNVLTVLLSTPVEINTQRGSFTRLDQRYQARLASFSSREAGHTPPKLGDPVALGSRVWDQQSGLQIGIFGIDYDTSEKWLPYTDEFKQLAELLRYTSDGKSTIELVINVKNETIPRSSFANGLRLGFNSWLKTEAALTGGGGFKQTKRTVHPTRQN